MTTRNQIPYSTLDDLIFEGRNREYGAYLLRKIYNQHLLRALVISTSLCLLFLSLPLIATKLYPEKAELIKSIEKDPFVLINVDLPVFEEPVVPPPVIEQPAPAAAAPTRRFTDNIVITRNPVNPAEIPTQEELDVTPAGTQTTEGTPGATGELPIVGGVITDVPAPVAQPEFIYAEKMPQFPGGEKALLKYLADKTVYPELAKRNSLQGLVVLSFLVNAQGNITDIQVVKSMGGGLDEEAIRVVKSMPRWEPGRNNGTPVNVRFKLPVRFAIR
ncbi:MAG TPA: energy transducer TonB [Adhaeribacter sp.]|nr:energy transducer TonB [Adhaeribacter sp.]